MSSVAPAGLSDVQARIASIQARLGSLGASQPAPGFAAAAAATTGTAGTPAGSVVTGATATAGTPAGPAAPSGSASVEASAAAAKLEQVLPEAGKRWAGAIATAAEEHGVDPSLLAALVRHESNFDPNVRSHAGAIGLGQLMPGTAAGLGVDPHDPIENLDGAARYLKAQLDRFGSADLALAAYNAGPNRVAQAGGIPNITETKVYVDRVLTTWEQYR